jgi:multiple sugar transport system ATP-binding protein
VTARGALLNARVDPRTTARVGDRIRLALDPSRFHFFDAETGTSLLALGRTVHNERAASVAR